MLNAPEEIEAVAASSSSAIPAHDFEIQEIKVVKILNPEAEYEEDCIMYTVDPWLEITFASEEKRNTFAVDLNMKLTDRHEGPIRKYSKQGERSIALKIASPPGSPTTSAEQFAPALEFLTSLYPSLDFKDFLAQLATKPVSKRLYLDEDDLSNHKHEIRGISNQLALTASVRKCVNYSIENSASSSDPDQVIIEEEVLTSLRNMSLENSASSSNPPITPGFNARRETPVSDNANAPANNSDSDNDLRIDSQNCCTM